MCEISEPTNAGAMRFCWLLEQERNIDRMRALHVDRQMSCGLVHADLGRLGVVRPSEMLWGSLKYCPALV